MSYVNIPNVPNDLVKRLKIEAILGDYKGVGEYLRAFLIQHFQEKDKKPIIPAERPRR